MNKNKTHIKYYNFTGRLELKEDADYEYILINDNKNTYIEFNISEILNEHINTLNIVTVKLEHGYKTLFEEEGYLKYKPDNNGIKCYYICGANLDEHLFDRIGEYLNISIKVEEYMGDTK